jgi:hypothetical protein
MHSRRLTNHLRPITASLARFKSLLGMAAALSFATQHQAGAATIQWQGTTGPTPGDGLLWVDPFNWESDTIPSAFDDAVFGAGTPGVIHLAGDQTINSLAFNANFTLGAYGTTQILTNTSGVVSVTAGDFATINASYGGNNGLNLSGGGSLFLNHPLPRFGGNITVDGAGTTLVHRQEGPYPQYNGVGSAQEFGRFDQLTLGFTTTVRNITLTKVQLQKHIHWNRRRDAEPRARVPAAKPGRHGANQRDHGSVHESGQRAINHHHDDGGSEPARGCGEH